MLTNPANYLCLSYIYIREKFIQCYGWLDMSSVWYGWWEIKIFKNVCSAIICIVTSLNVVLMIAIIF